MRRLMALIVTTALVAAIGLPLKAEAIATGPSHVRYVGGQGQLPSGETFSFSVGYRWDGVQEGWLVYQRPGWREYRSLRITSVWVDGENVGDLWGEGSFAPASPVQFHVLVTGNQASSGGADVFRIEIWPGTDTPEVFTNLELSSGSITVTKAAGLQVYACGLRFDGNPFNRTLDWLRSVHVWIYYDGVPQSGEWVAAFVTTRHSDGSERVAWLGFPKRTDASGYARFDTERYSAKVVSDDYILGVLSGEQYLEFSGPFLYWGIFTGCNPWWPP